METVNENVSKMLQEAYEGSYYTILGCGGDINEWKGGYQELLNQEKIGTITKWIQFTGKDINKKFDLQGNNKFKDNLNILAFSLDNLNVGKLAMFKIKMGDRWFDDVIDNSIRRNGSF